MEETADAGGYVSPAQLRQGHPKVTDLIGRTPLVDLTRVAELKPGVRLLAKLESHNPGGSVKDRPAWGIVKEALADGRLGRGQTLLDATSGNTGIAYAMLGAALDFRVRLCVPAQASEERRAILAAYGAQVVLTDPMEGTNGAIREARRLAAEAGGGNEIFYADQYSNPANWRAHYDTTAVEILEQTSGEVTHFVAGLGTTGTLMGVGRRFTRERPGVTLVAVQPDAAFHGIEGLKHLPTAIVPAIYDPTVPDEQLAVSTEEALRLTRLLARREGILAGISSGAALAAALRVAAAVEEATIVVLFPDGGDRYTSQGLWEGPA